MKNRVLYLLILALLFAACDKKVHDYSLKDGFDDNAKISFTATIDQRKADGQKSFAQSDAIAVFGLKYNGNTPEILNITSTYIANAEYTMNNSLFTKSFPQRFWGEKMDFIAYTPYLPTLTSTKPQYTLAPDQSSGYKQYDVMYAKKSSCTAADMPAALEFSHLFAKMEFNLTRGTSISSLEGIEIKVKNLINKVELDLSDGTLVQQTSVEYMAPYKVAIDKYEMIVVPQSIAAQSVLFEFTLGGEVIKWKTQTPVNITASTLVKVNVTVESNAVDVTITGNIDGWEDDDNPVTGETN